MLPDLRTTPLGFGLLFSLGSCMSGCVTGGAPSSDPPATALPTLAPLTSGAATLPTAAGPRAFQYDLVLTGLEGGAASARLSVVASNESPGSISFGKNVLIGPSNRSDVGTKLMWRFTMRGETPVLDVDATISTFDAAAGTVHRASAQGSAPTPPGTTTVILETTEGGRHYQLKATPTPIAALGPPATDARYSVDVAITQAGDASAAAKTTRLTLALDGDTPGRASFSEDVPLVVGPDGGIRQRQSTGSFVKAVAHRRADGLDLDLVTEVSAAEGGSPGVNFRKILTRGPVFAPFDKVTTAFTAEENGQRYEVTVAPHRAP